MNGIETFPGKILHAHDLRNASELKGLSVLCVGGGFSGLDITIQALKYDAKTVDISLNKPSFGIAWPEDKVTEMAKVQRVVGSKVTFSDGKECEYDVIIWCTGYKHEFPFLEPKLRLKSSNVLYPNHLYKGVVFTEAANNRLFYIGMQNLVYSFPMFNLQSLLILKLISGEFAVPGKTEMEADYDRYLKK